jgi:spore photoproduct lyase
MTTAVAPPSAPLHRPASGRRRASWSPVRPPSGHKVAAALPADADLTVECITHRFTPGSKETLLDRYPRTKLDMDESRRTTRRGKYGSVEHVYPRETMSELRGWFEAALGERLPQAQLLYWT